VKPYPRLRRLAQLTGCGPAGSTGGPAVPGSDGADAPVPRRIFSTYPLQLTLLLGHWCRGHVPFMLRQ
jgi:hypothetical protein